MPPNLFRRAVAIVSSCLWLGLNSGQAQPALQMERMPDGRLRLHWPQDASGFALEAATALSAGADFEAAAETPELIGGEWTVTLGGAPVTRFFRLRQLTAPRAVRVVSSSPQDGESGVAVTRETVIRFDGPLAGDALLGANQLFAEAAGRRLLTRAEWATDRRSVSLFYQEPLPGAARVVVTLDGTGVNDLLGFELDADGDTVPGGATRIRFDTMNNVAVGETAVVGRVLASEPNPDGSDRPIAGVTVTVDGQEETLRAITGEDGAFVLQPAPAGRFFVHVDGRTAEGSGWPGGAYYPFVGKAWDAVPGRTNNPAGGTGLIYLPLIPADALQAINPVAETRITFAPSVLAANPALAGVEIDVPANALFADSGARGGRVGIAPVPPDRLPEALPAGLSFPLVITIQTDGPSNFDRPVPVKFPNLPDPVTGELLPPGAKTALWSFNHDTGRWEIQGPMTISADGLFALSDAGVGVRQPGWHGVNPGSEGDGPDDDDEGDGDDGPDKEKDEDDCKDGNENGICDDDDRLRCEKDILSLIFSGLDCLDTLLPSKDAGGPLAECIKTIAKGTSQTIRNCRLNTNECENEIIVKSLEMAAGCAKELPALKSVKPFIEGLEKAKCLLDTGLAYKSLQLCLNATPASSPVVRSVGRQAVLVAGIPSAGNPFLQQYEIEDSFRVLFGLIYGNPKWAHIRMFELPLFSNLMTAVSVSVADGSEEGAKLSAGELASLLALPRPGGTTEGDVAALGGRFSRLRQGVLTPAEFDGTAIADAADRLSAIVEEVENEGWSHIHEGYARGHARLVAALAAPVGAVVVGAGAVPQSEVVRQGATPSGKRDLPDRPLLYVVRDLETGFEIRGRLNAVGNVDGLILRPDAPYRVAYLDPLTARSGLSYFQSASAGRRTLLPSATLVKPPALPDSDGDGLSDLGEYVLGTQPGIADSDGDGVSDGAELANGTNPLDGTPLVTGVVATVETPGEALDVAVGDGFAVVADGSAGVGVLDVRDPLAPVLAAQLDLAGNPKTVAVSGDRALLATGSRYYVVNVGDVSSPSIIADVALSSANRVAVAGRTGFVNSGSKVRAVDLADGSALGEVTLPAVVGDLAVTRDLLLALTSTELRVLRFVQVLPGDPVEWVPLGAIPVAGSAAPLEDGRRLFAAGDRAYAGHFRGYSIIGIADLNAPVLLGKEPVTQAAVHDLAADGSGVLTVVSSFGGTSTLAVSAYDITDDSDVTRLLSSWNTPGNARALSLYRGLALVADTANGVQVLNFKAADSGTNAPTIVLEPLLPEPGIAESRGNLRVIANTADDVMVREVEFYLDGQRVATDGSFPFEWHGVAPSLTTEKIGFTVRARAVDTGGNSTWSEELTIGLQDTTPLRIVSTEPGPGPFVPVAPVIAVAVQFDEPVAVESVTPTSLTLVAAGPNGTFGDVDDVPLAGTVQLGMGGAGLRLILEDALTGGRYRATVAGSVANRSDVVLGADVTWDFEVRAPKVTPVSPTPGSVLEELRLTEARAQFDQPIDPATVTAATVQLTEAGADGIAGNDDDGLIVPDGVDYDAANRVVRWHRAAPLTAGRYTVRLRKEIAGVSGTPLGADTTWSFDVRGPVFWARDSDGLWTVATNWSEGRLPNRDYVVMDRPGGITVSASSLNVSLGWLRAEESLALGGSTLRLADDSFIHGALGLDNSTVVASNRLNLTGAVSLVRNSTLDGLVSAAGAIVVEGTGTKRLRRELSLSGSLQLREGPLGLPGSTLTIEPGALLDFMPAGSANAGRDLISNGSGSMGTLRNRGTIRHLGDTRALNVQTVNVSNDGLIEAETGGLATQGGRFDQGPSGRLRMNGPVLFNGMSGDWAGELHFPGGLTVRNSGVTLRSPLRLGDAGLTWVDGDLTVRAPQVLKDPVLSNGLGLHLFDVLDLDGATNINLVADGDGRLRTRGTVSFISLEVGGSVRWENSGTLIAAGRSFTLADASFLHNAPEGVMEILGTLAGPVSGSPDTGLLNEGRIRAAGTGSLDSNSADLRIRVKMENRGRIDVESGRLTVDGETRHTGTLNVSAGAILRFSHRNEVGGIHTFLPESTVGGPGTVEIGSSATAVAEVDGVWHPGLTRVAGGTLRLPGDRQLDRLSATAGTVESAGLTEVTDRLDWQGGALAGAGVLRLTGQFQSVSNRFPALLGGARFELASTVELDFMAATGAEPGSFWRILPQGELIAHRGGTFGVGDIFTQTGAFLNEGRLTKSLAEGALRFLVPLTNAGVITIRSNRFSSERRFIQTAGQLVLEGGTLHLDGGNGGSNASDSGYGLELHGGELIGFGLIDAPNSTLRPMTNNAVVRPGLPVGRLMLQYVNYAQTTNGTLEIEIGGLEPGTEHDQLVCDRGSRIKALAGRLDVRLINGFVPAIGDRFLVVSGALLNSDDRFTETDLPALPAGRRWLVNYLRGTAPGIELQVAVGP